MKFLVVGLGSMGKRRVRSLLSLGYSDIVGFDLREDRRIESKTKYSIKTIESINEITVSDFTALIISVPPDKHLDYIEIAIENRVPAFIEASVISEHTKIILENNQNSQVFLAPSCTLRFHPVIKDIKDIIKSNKYGKLTNFTFHSGQYLPDWHPWENVNEFYVSNRETGGGREIVPFELTWIVDVFGFPKQVKGYFNKTLNFGTDIDDSYAFAMKFEQGLGAMIVDVASRFATRSLIINLEEAQIRWNWEEEMLKVYEAKKNRWINYLQPRGKAESGYNKNIIEEMYVEEIKYFIEGIKDSSKYPNSLENDLKVLSLLDEVENSDGGFNR